MKPIRRAHANSDEESRRLFEAIFAEHYDAVLAYAAARADIDTAREVVADTFLVAWRRLDIVPAQPRGWLIAVARRVLADHRRSVSRRDSLISRVSRERVPVAAAPDDALIHREQLLGAWQGLSSSDQEVLRLIAWDGLSRTDAAEALGCTRAGFAVRLHRARKRFESLLAAQEPTTATTLPASVCSEPNQAPQPRQVGSVAPNRGHSVASVNGRTEAELSNGKADG
jgi:RNA polymerase sigma-70 factor (ECF subfamily)